MALLEQWSQLRLTLIPTRSGILLATVTARNTQGHRQWDRHIHAVTVEADNALLGLPRDPLDDLALAVQVLRKSRRA